MSVGVLPYRVITLADHVIVQETDDHGELRVDLGKSLLTVRIPRNLTPEDMAGEIDLAVKSIMARKGR